MRISLSLIPTMPPTFDEICLQLSPSRLAWHSAAPAAQSQGFPAGEGRGGKQWDGGFQQLLSSAKSCQISESLCRVAPEVRGLLEPGVEEK